MSGQLNRQLCGILGTAGALGQRCGLASVLAACVIASAGARAEDMLSIATWGGAYGQSQEIAYFEPFAKETGTKIATEIYDGTLAKIKQMIGGDESEVDVVDVSAATLGTLCNDGLLEPIEASSLGAAPGGESAEQDFYSGALSSCGVASVAWSTAIAFDRQALSKNQPSEIAALLDTKRFPGKRSLPDTARYTLELA
ncbi:MAG: extracellular solute-binding protein, partial [Methylocella sp.]